MEGFNLWGIVAAAAASIAIGSLWYGPLFQKPWMKMTGLTKESMKSTAMTPVRAMAGGVVTSLLTAGVLAWLADAAVVLSVGDALRMACWVWLGFAVPMSAGAWLWEGKPFKLFLLNAAQYLVSLAAMSLIVGLWR